MACFFLSLSLSQVHLPSLVISGDLTRSLVAAASLVVVAHSLSLPPNRATLLYTKLALGSASIWHPYLYLDHRLPLVTE